MTADHPGDRKLATWPSRPDHARAAARSDRAADRIWSDRPSCDSPTMEHAAGAGAAALFHVAGQMSRLPVGRLVRPPRIDMVDRGRPGVWEPKVLIDRRPADAACPAGCLEDRSPWPVADAREPPEPTSAGAIPASADSAGRRAELRVRLACRKRSQADRANSLASASEPSPLLRGRREAWFTAIPDGTLRDWLTTGAAESRPGPAAVLTRTAASSRGAGDGRTAVRTAIAA